MTASCSRYNDENSCIIKAPDIIQFEFMIHGWNIIANTETSIWDVKIERPFSSNANWYAIISYTRNFEYTGSSQTWVVPTNGNYRIELWGAQGGPKDPSLELNSGGYAGYTSGEINLLDDLLLYLYIGGAPVDGSENIGGYNGGGSGGTNLNPIRHAGGGATDVRFINGFWNDSNGLNSRIMVAAGGGGISATGNDPTKLNRGSAGGGLIGEDGRINALNTPNYNQVIEINSGATQTAGGLPGIATSFYGVSGMFGQAGGRGLDGNTTSQNQFIFGGGGGYYGGSASAGGTNTGTTGSGGSSYISGHTGCVAITSATDQTPKAGCDTGTTNLNCSLHYSNKIFTNTIMIDGSGYGWTNEKGSLLQMPNPLGGNYELGQGHSGNGYAKITYIGQ